VNRRLADILRTPDTEKLICSKLIEMMETTPFYQIKVSHLVNNAVISRSTFYLYFDSIYAVIQKIEDDFIENMPIGSFSVGNSNTKFDPVDLSSELYAGVEYMKQNINTFRVLSGNNGDPSFQSRLMNRSWKLMKNRFTSLSDGSATEKRLVFEYLLGGQWSLIKWWASHENELTTKDVSILIGKLMSQAFNLL